MRRSVLPVLGLIAGLMLFPPVAAAQSGECTIAYVVDGDTVNCEGGRQLRLLLVDAPEQGAFGELARNALAALLPVGRSFRYEIDGPGVDKQGRTLVYLFLADGGLANEMMVRQGYAFLKPSSESLRYADRVRLAERKARERQIGIWSK